MAAKSRTTHPLAPVNRMAVQSITGREGTYVRLAVPQGNSPMGRSRPTLTGEALAKNGPKTRARNTAKKKKK